MNKRRRVQRGQICAAPRPYEALPSDGRATYTAIGLQMNVAARIQAQCEPGGTLLSSASWHLVKDTVECDPLGEVTVKGVHFPISIYAPRTPADRGPA